MIYTLQIATVELFHSRSVLDDRSYGDTVFDVPNSTAGKVHKHLAGGRITDMSIIVREVGSPHFHYSSAAVSVVSCLPVSAADSVFAPRVTMRRLAQKKKKKKQALK